MHRNKKYTKEWKHMSTNVHKTVGRVTHTTQVISRNKLDRGFCAQRVDIVDDIKLVIQTRMYS